MKLPFSLCIVLLLVTFVSFGQTALNPAQMNPGSAPVAQVLVVTSSGEVRWATIGSGVTLTCPAGGACTISVSAAPVLKTVMVTPTAVLTSQTLPAVPSELAITRNGLELSETVDYTVSGAVITFVAAARPQIGDLVKFKYR